MSASLCKSSANIQLLRKISRQQCPFPLEHHQSAKTPIPHRRRPQFLANVTYRGFASLQRAASSVATVLNDDDDDDNYNASDYEHHLEAKKEQSNHTRPRLEALRKQLQKEETQSKQSLQSFVDRRNVKEERVAITRTTTSVMSSPSTMQSTMDQSQQLQQQHQKTVAAYPSFTNDDASDPHYHHHDETSPALHETESILMDRFRRKHTYLRLSLTERCNLRCTYCMPEQGVPLQPESHLLQTHEILYLAEYFAKAGVTKFRLTGGEPTLRKDLIDIVHGIAQLQPKEFVGMTTNGVTLYKYLPDLVQAGLQSVNISLDTMKPDVFEHLTRRPASYLTRVWDSLHMALDIASSQLQSQQQQQHAHKPLSVKLNCVVMRGINDNEVLDFIRLTDQYPHLKVRFIEYMPFAENGWNTEKYIGYRELLSQPEIQAEAGLIPDAVVADKHDTTKWYTTTTSYAAGGGKIGFITSMSNPFCGGCNRLRITADGQLKTCLFGSTYDSNGQQQDHGSLSLRDALRVSGQVSSTTSVLLDKIIVEALQKKHYKLGGHANPLEISAHSGENRPMTLIGG